MSVVVDGIEDLFLERTTTTATPIAIRRSTGMTIAKIIGREGEDGDGGDADEDNEDEDEDNEDEDGDDGDEDGDDGDEDGEE